VEGLSVTALAVDLAFAASGLDDVELALFLIDPKRYEEDTSSGRRR
jgi:hypothetical protein